MSEYKNDLLELKEIDYQRFAKEKLIYRSVERTLQIAIEACLDIGQRIIAEEGFRAPENYRDVFAVLNEAGILPDDLLPALSNMVGFRNLIVHDYARVDLAAVYGILQGHLGDFDRFARAITEYIDAQG